MIKASKFIDTVENQNIALGEMGKYLNIMAFAEAQLEVRLLNLINMQKTYQDSVEVLQKEFRALQDNLKDSEFIEALKANRPDVRLFSFDAEAKNNWKTIEINEKIGMFMARGLLEMQSYFNTLVEEINANTVKLADQSPSDSSRKFLKKRTLSVQYSITTLPVIKENSTTTSFYQFDQMVKSLLLHKFNDFSSPTCQKFVKVLSHSEILKSFLTSSDISFFLGSIDESISMFRNFYLLYKPAHENLRRKIGISLRSVLSFISGIKVTSGQIMLSFDRNILSGRQTDKLMALDPKVKYVSRGLKEIIQERIEKNLAGVHTKGNSQGIIRKNPEIQVAGQDSDEEIFAKTAKTSRQTPHKGKWRTQKDFKAHLNSLSSMLLKSSKKKFK